MRKDWLETSAGVNVVAIGIVAILFSLAIFTLQDFAILFTGRPDLLRGLRGIWYLLWAAVAAVFSVMTVFIWRPGWPRIVITLFSISMVSHVLEQFVKVPAQQLRLVAVCRIFIDAALILLILRYRSTTTSGRFRQAHNPKRTSS